MPRTTTAITKEKTKSALKSPGEWISKNRVETATGRDTNQNTFSGTSVNFTNPTLGFRTRSKNLTFTKSVISEVTPETVNSRIRLINFLRKIRDGVLERISIVAKKPKYVKAATGEISKAPKTMIGEINLL